MPQCSSCNAPLALGAESCTACGRETDGPAKLASHALGFFNAQYFAEAAALFERAHRECPEDPALEVAWAHALHHQGRRGQAARIYHKVAAAGSVAPEVEFNLARHHLDKGRLDAAHEIFERLSKTDVAFQPNAFYLGAVYATPSEFRSDCLYHLALVHWNKGDTAFARIYFEQTVALTPGHAAAQRHLGNLLFQAGQFERSVACHRCYFQLALGSSVPQDEQLDARFRMAMALAELGRTDEAIEEFKRVTEQRPGHPGAIHQLSRLYAQQGIAGEEDLHKPPVIEASEGASTLFGLSTQPQARGESQSGSGPIEHHPIIGKSLAMQRVLRSARLSAASDSTVLIIGENGTGKELIAHAIHENSSRRSGPFITVSCAAVPENLLESELFGHERGAFTGATSRRVGRIESASGGTLFLDEISALTPAMQVSLLRFLQSRTFSRVGGNEILRTDLRLIAATNANLDARIKEGLFREDFYFRISVLPIQVPPLRDRAEDIPLLAEFFIRKYKHESSRRDYVLDPDELTLLKAHTWPGNVRELENLVERGLVMGTQISAILGARPHAAPTSPPSGAPGESSADMISRLIAEGRIPERRQRGTKASQESWRPSTLDDLEREHILRTLRHTGGHKSKAARLLGINPATLWRKMRQYSIETENGDQAPKDS